MIIDLENMHAKAKLKLATQTTAANQKIADLEKMLMEHCNYIDERAKIEKDTITRVFMQLISDQEQALAEIAAELGHKEVTHTLVDHPLSGPPPFEFKT
jgi:hypothetical protein